MTETTSSRLIGGALPVIALCFALVISLFTPGPVRAEPAVLFAAPSGQRAGNCTSWADACGLQMAFAVAINGNGSWVKAGVREPASPRAGISAFGAHPDAVPPTVLSITRLDPNPTAAASIRFQVTFSEEVIGVDAVDFSLATSGITGAAVADVSGGPAAYTVTVSTGTGEGTLRLDVPVTATITDPLGTALGDLPYTGGQPYTVDRTGPTVLSILRASPNPTGASSVDFAVTFSESVMGVAVDDFSLTTGGRVSGPSVLGITGTGATRTVSVGAGAGGGTLRLDIPGSATITDLAGNLLGGLPYEDGEVYTIWYKLFLPLTLKGAQ